MKKILAFIIMISLCVCLYAEKATINEDQQFEIIEPGIEYNFIRSGLYMTRDYFDSNFMMKYQELKKKFTTLMDELEFRVEEKRKNIFWSDFWFYGFIVVASALVLTIGYIITREFIFPQIRF